MRWWWSRGLWWSRGDRGPGDGRGLVVGFGV